MVGEEAELFLVEASMLVRHLHPLVHLFALDILLLLQFLMRTASIGESSSDGTYERGLGSREERDESSTHLKERPRVVRLLLLARRWSLAEPAVSINEDQARQP